MAVSVTCPGCRTSYPVTEDLLGKKIRCKKCQESFTAAVSKSKAGARGGDERIQTRPSSRDRYEDDDYEDTPRRNGNGRGYPDRRSQAGKGNSSGLLIGGIVFGAVLLVGGGAIGYWMMNSEPVPDQPTVASVPVAANNNSSTTPPAVTRTDTNTAPKDDPNKAAAQQPTMRTADAPDKIQIVKGKHRPAEPSHETIARIKKSAAWITITTEQGTAWGSGWVAERHGNEAYIVTNAHVVGMKEVAKPAPEKIDVTIDSGLSTERHYDATIVALDRDEDLCVLRIKGRDLPDPLKIAPSYDLVESQRLLTMGFPLGGTLVKRLQAGLNTGELKTTLKVRPTTIAGRIFNKDGDSVKYIQIEGGVDPGNSGGAAVDTNGNVVAVVVAQAPGTNMKYIIPSEYVIHMLLGRLLKIVPGQAISSGGNIKLPITAQVVDPIRRLRKVDAEVWVGAKPDAAKKQKSIRPSSEHPPTALEGDGPRAVATLDYDANAKLSLGASHHARAELSLPPLQDNQVYWFQPHYYSKDGSQRWGEAVVMEMGRFPVEARPAMLATKHKPDTTPRQLEIDSRQAFGYHIEEIGPTGNDIALKARMTEKITSVEQNGDAKVLIQYIDLHLADSDTDNFIRKSLKGVLEAVKYLRTTVTLTKSGSFRSPVPDVANVPREARPMLKKFNEQIIQSLDALSLSLPGKEMQPGDTWDQENAYTFAVERNYQNALFKMKCKYVGSRVRNGREEAVIEIVGTVVKNNSGDNPNGPAGGGRRGGGSESGPGSNPSPSPDNNNNTESIVDEDGQLKLGFHGIAHGAAIVDIATGRVILARTEADMAVVFPANLRNPENPQQELQVKVFAGLYFDVMLNRSLDDKPPKPADVALLLPNQPRTYNPLVGVDSNPTDTTSMSTEPVVPAQNTLMARDVWDRVKRSAVMIGVERNDGSGEGSGWFAGPGIIVTNCHVVGMLNKADRPPEKITVYLDRGTKDERKLDAELMVVNRDDDLAVIRVKGDNLPEPMTITPSASLVESDKLSVLGFPRGSSLTKGLERGLGGRDFEITLKARNTTVTGRVPNADTSTKYIQLEGGADHGNSGGAIVDSKGEVRAVLVAGFDGYELRWGIPSEYASRMVQGYPLEILPGRAYLENSVAKQPIEIRFSDPMNRLKEVNIDYWVGGPGRPRLFTDKTPKSLPGDGTRQSIKLELKPADRPGERFAVGEFTPPSMAPGQVCWLQPRFTNGTGKEQWSKAIAYAPDGPPVERKPVVLKTTYKRGTSRGIELTTFTNVYSKKLGQGQREGYPLQVRLTENVLAVSRQGTATVQLKYEDLELDLKKILPQMEDVPPQVRSVINQQLKPFLALIRGVITVVRIDRNGKMKLAPNGLSYANLPLPVQPQMDKFNAQILTSLQAATFPLPGKEVPYGYTWEFPTDLFVATRNRFDPATFKMKFKYLGVRERGGRQEAIVEITGSLASNPNAKGIGVDEGKEEPDVPAPPGADHPDPANPASGRYDDPATPAKKGRRGLFGVARGHALVDVKDGFVSEVKLFVDLDIETTAKDPTTKEDVPVDAGGTMELQLKRHLAK